MTWWRRLVNGKRLEHELDAELRDHVERQTADLVAAGIPEGEARRRAQAALGGIEATKEYCRDARGTRWIGAVWQDVRYAARMWRKTPGITAVAVLSLALGIGANTAIFSLVNALLLRSLPVRAPEQLVMLAHGSWTYPIWEQVRDRSPQLFDGAAAFASNEFDLAQGGRAEPVEGLWTSGEFFEVLGVPAMLGRTFTAADDRRGGGPDGPVAVISYAFWQRRFGGASSVVGRSITLDRVSFTIVGVTPPEFLGPLVGRSYDVAVPFGTEPLVHGAETWLDGRSTWWIDIMARLKPGQTVDEATRRLRAAQPQIRAATLPEGWPQQELRRYLSDPFTLVPAATGPSWFRNRYQRPLLTMMIVVGLILMIACANIATLQLGRANARRHELSLRQALGASRNRIIRQLLTESLLLAGVGAAVGLVFARWAARLLVDQLSTFQEVVALDLSLDWRVLAFTGAVSVATALLFGIAPALRGGRHEPLDALREQGRGGGVSRRRLGDPLVAAQVALSLVLVIGAGLFLRTFTALASLDPGFASDPVLLVNVNAQHSTAVPPARAALIERARAAVAAVPGVARASISVITPLSGRGWNDAIEDPGTTRSERDRMAWFNAVSPGWFATYGTALVAGRDFDARDRRGSEAVAIVNQAYVRKFLDNRNPIGEAVRPQPTPDRTTAALQIVGVVRDAAYRDLREPFAPIVYVPYAQMDGFQPPDATISIRAAQGFRPAMLARGVAQAVARVDKDLSLRFLPLREQVDQTLVRERLMAMVSAFFGGLALLLAGVGLYGIASNYVSLRRTEIGIRMALGADRGGVQRMVVWRVAVLVAAGAVVGTVISLWAAQFVGSLLYGLEPRDPLTIAGAAALLAAVALGAAWLPARRASHIDPSVVLREG